VKQLRTTDVSPRGVERLFVSKEVQQLIGVLASIRNKPRCERNEILLRMPGVP